MMRSTTAAPAPSRMPHLRCDLGSERHASAITTALSPDSSRSIQMICTRESQKVGEVKSMGRPRRFRAQFHPAQPRAGRKTQIPDKGAGTGFRTVT